MSQRGRPRKEDASTPDLPRDLTREDREAVQDRQFQMIMTSIQALSNIIQTFMKRQQPQQPQNNISIPEVEVAPSLPPAAPVELVEPVGITPTASQYKIFVSTKPPRFIGKEGPDKAKEWLEEVEKAFDIMEIPAQL
ncbi:unnamed protein product [Victoria cruziana]